MLTIDPHPLSRPSFFVTTFERPLGELLAGEGITALLRPDAPSPRLTANDDVRGAVRDLLRHGGFKPTGRSKPASEYLAKAAAERGLSAINAAVDAANAVSLHSGLPISVIDAGKVKEPLRIGIAPAGSRYVFNPSGQEIDVEGLLSVIDAEGPCANAVKDAQRTKTTPETTRTLTVLWGYAADEKRVQIATKWLEELYTTAGGASLH
jgi:DNA/RNA-binding domain of Phe-tRNA-synthetase-like protein